ncbi:MAG: flagellar hook-length control protein FliK [Betaproteobacteria bacterium]|nr:flagellar hook-length control protein FliK [Betaproteobacteria bacterium]
MIPSDLAARLRFLHEASFFETSPPVAGLNRARDIQTQLQELIPGQRFLATLQRTLPDGTFRALVAGQQVTLALNASANPGDTLELVATNVSPKMVLSRLATPADGANASSARPSLSPTGQLISFLLTGQPVAKPAILLNGQPLFQTPLPASGSPAGNVADPQAAIVQTAATVTANARPATVGTQPAANTQLAPTSVQLVSSGAQLASTSAQLAPLLRQALSQSGLFYEAHQVQWLAGKIDLATLLHEPQAQGTGQPQTGNPATAGSPSTLGTATPPAPNQTTGGAGSTTDAGVSPRAGNAAATPANAAAQALARNEPSISQVREVTGQQAEAMRNNPIAERLLPIVYQQLESLASHQYIWHGMAWPNQMFEWIIEDPRGEGHAGGEDAGGQWDTTLRLTLPRLGGVEARMLLGAKGVALRLQVDDKAAVGKLETRRNELAEALEAAGVPLTGMSMEYRDGS